MICVEPLREKIERLLILFDLHRLFLGFFHLVAKSGLEEHGIVAEERFMYLERFGFGSDVGRYYLDPPIAENFSVHVVMDTINIGTYIRSLLEGFSMIETFTMVLLYD